jgi:hypothetical protein
MTTTRSEVARVHTFDLGRWWLVGDRLLPKIAGGSEGATEDAGGAGDEGEPGSGGAGQEGDEGEDKPESTTGAGDDGDQDKGKGKGKDQDLTPRPGEDRGAFKARQRAARAERERDDARQQLEDLLDKDRTEQEKLEKRARKAEDRVSVLEPTVRQQAIHIAFLLASAGDAKRKAVQWVDAGDALLLVAKELEGIKVGDDGDIDHDEVVEIVTRIAKQKSHLVRKAQPAQEQPSGGNVGAGSRTPQEKGVEELSRTYTALRTRSPR